MAAPALLIPLGFRRPAGVIVCAFAALCHRHLPVFDRFNWVGADSPQIRNQQYPHNTWQFGLLDGFADASISAPMAFGKGSARTALLWFTIMAELHADQSLRN